ncbi:uncharacterized protein LOC122013620 [Zingiber officinale]|uniref:GTD-binding domain-containing protein n=1 Tax=Zingiber officinale TaxID=94328 RepID=A0A8J5FBH0_ZINOF|nr:uncharacterized protein LOC122013620 [Zingiber officinale]KAG6482001.1 hypothetical protein ZIOFF_058628 [Zingiber officinale]
MAQREVAIMKEVLHQYILIKKLHMEIEEERQASATAASEALSMILRLQKEKAEEKMEACQYRRLTEEKLHHAQECSVILEEAMQEKEMEISMLKQQIQLCNSKLLSAGISDLDFAGTETGDDTAPIVSRNISLPPIRTDRQWIHPEEAVDTPDSAASSNFPYRSEPERDAIQVACVYDIFEVPGSDKFNRCASELVETENCLGKEHLTPEETREDGNSEKISKHAYHNRSVSMPMRLVSTPTKGEMTEFISACVDSVDETCDMKNDFETIKCQLKQINCERMMQMEDSERSKEQLKLLRGIYEQLSTIESHMNISKPKSHIDDQLHLASVMEAFLSFAI